MSKHVGHRTVSVLAVYLVGIVAVVCFGTLRHRDDFLFDHDTRFWFVGGLCWWHGDSPYAPTTFLDTWVATFGEAPRFRSAFVYPGSILPVSLLLGSMPWDVARWVMRFVSLAALVGSMLLLRNVARERAGGPVPRERDLWIGASALAPGVTLAMFQGQLSLLATFGLCVAWRGLRQRRSAWLVGGLLLASIKPQLVVVAVIFLIVRFWDRRIWLALGAVAAANALVLAWSTPMQLLADARASLAEHAAQEFNRPDNYDSLVAHLPAIGTAPVTLWLGAFIGCVVAALLGARARVRLPAVPHAGVRLLQIVLVLTGVLMPVHRYDLAIHVPLVGTLWALGSRWRAGLMYAFVMLHAGATWICWHAAHTFGVVVDYHVVAAGVAAAELVALTIWWHGDTVRNPAGALPAGAEGPWQ